MFSGDFRKVTALLLTSDHGDPMFGVSSVRKLDFSAPNPYGGLY